MLHKKGNIKLLKIIRLTGAKVN